MATDFELLDRWRAGEREAGNELFQRHFASISRFFKTKVDREVDELIQATFYALIERQDQFRKQASFRTYLFAIAKNELYRHLRARYRAGARIDFTTASLVDLGTTPTQRLRREEQRALLLEALRALPVEQQLLIELHYWEGLSLEHLALVFEIEPSSVRSRLFRARKALRARLDASPGPFAGAEPGSSDALLDAWARSLRAQWAGEPDGHEG